MSKVVDCFSEERSFPKLEGDSRVLKDLKDLFDVLYVTLYSVGET